MTLADGLCDTFITHHGHRYVCQLATGHAGQHRGVGQNPGVYTAGAGVLYFSTGDPGVNGQFRHPDDHSGLTPTTGHDPLVPTSDG